MAMNDNLILGLLELLLENLAFANVGSSGGLQPSSPAGNLYLSLHTADPGPTGNQTTSEAAYTGYARVAVSRASGSFTLTGTTFSLAANAVFPTATGGSETETYAGLGTAATGSGELLWTGAITPSLSVSTGLAPVLTTGTTFTMT
jgi:hypothetical protein